MDAVCAGCGGGPMTTEVRDRKISYRGINRQVTLQLTHCAACGSDYADESNAALNAAAVRELWKQIDKELGS